MRAFNSLRRWPTSWEQPDPLTLVFHLRDGVRFHDGRPLTARDVVWTIDSMRYRRGDLAQGRGLCVGGIG